MDLKEYRFGLNSVVFKIISFTSNSYRGRLFVSYLLSMPFAIYYGWNGLISNFVS